MKRPTRRQIVLIVLGVLLVAFVVYGLLPTPISVETAEVRSGPLRVMVEDEGETRVVDRYEVSSPVAAYARRVEVEAGDYVESGQPLVSLEAPRAPILDPRTQAEAQARVASARAQVAQADEQVRSAEAAARLAREERARAERLAGDAAITQQQLDQAVMEGDRAEAALEAARAAATTARAELAAAQSTLDQPSAGASLGVQSTLTAPAAGRVLTVHRRSAGHVNPAEPILEIGDTQQMEVQVDVLSQDAVRIAAGTRVEIDEWGGDRLLEGIVHRVEPQAFTRVSSLGVEEQRVTIVAGMTSPLEAWEQLGAGYRVLARFIVWEGSDVLQVPTSALFRTDDGWAAFVVEGDVARRRDVEVGQQAGLQAQILSGLQAGERVIVHPANEIEDGVAVDPSN